jgi:hypothetical protein
MNTILTGDCLEMLGRLPGGSFDAAFCDPPYGLSDARPANSATPRKSSRDATRGGFMGMKWDARVPGPEVWAAVFRVLKPGGPLLAFGGTRAHHRLMCAIEDAGFEIRDCLMWRYGQGFPKSLDIGKAIDKAAGAKREVIGRSTNGSGPHQTKPANHGKGDTGIGYIDGSGKVFDITAPSTDAGRQWDGYGTALKPAYEPVIVAMKPCDGTFVGDHQKT